MNATAPTMPPMLSLYHRDLTMQHAMKACATGVLFALGGCWMMQSLNPTASVERDFDAATAQFFALAGVLLASLCALIIARRYFWLKQVLRDGTVVNATLDQLESHYKEQRSDATAIRRRSYRYHHYANVSYEYGGVAHNVRIKLASAGSTYHLVKGGKTELSILPGAAHTPLIRAVYLC
jgi:hypothetical protein